MVPFPTECRAGESVVKLSFLLCLFSLFKKLALFTVFLVIFHQLQEADDDPLARLKGQKMVSCRICKGDHWTTKCPYKDSLMPPQEAEMDKKKPEDTPASAPPASAGGQRLGKYVPPSLREGGNRKGESMVSKTRGNNFVFRKEAFN
jgi:hypothetical protein